MRIALDKIIEAMINIFDLLLSWWPSRRKDGNER
jgi:hypothetical protein